MFVRATIASWLRRLVLTLLTTGLASAAEAREPGPGPTIEWDAPEACPQLATVQRTLAAALGPESMTTGGQLEVRATLSPQDIERWTLTLTLSRDGVERTREIEAQTCEGLTSAAVLVIAIAIDPSYDGEPITLLSEDPTTAIPAPPPESERRDEPDAPRSAAENPAAVADDDPRTITTPASRGDAAAAPPSGIELSLRATAGPGLRLLPAVSGALELGLAVLGRRWRAELAANYWTPVRGSLGGDLDARFQLASAVVRGCGVPGVGSVRFPLCVGLDAGAMTGRGIDGFATVRTARHAWVAARAGAFVAWRLHPRVSLWAGGEAIVPLRIPEFGTDDRASLVVIPRLGVAAVAGLEVRLTAPKDWAPSVL